MTPATRVVRCHMVPRGVGIRFGPLNVQFDHDVLRPRAWTLAQARWGAQLAAQLPDGPVLELCAGAGHIGLVLAMLARRDVVLVDSDAHACGFARANADEANLVTRVEVRNDPVQSALGPDERFAVILVDSPWVPSTATGCFPEDPRAAIDGGHDGLDLARECIGVIACHLAEGGTSILQLGTEAQAASIQTYLQQHCSLGLEVQELRTAHGGVLARLGSNA